MTKVFLNSTLLVLLFFLASCSNAEKENGELHGETHIEIEYSNGSKKTVVVQGITAESYTPVLNKYCTGKTGSIAMAFKPKDENYTFIIKSEFINGKTEGFARSFVVIDGKKYLSSITNFKNDIKDGPAFAFYPPNGNIQYIGNFVDGEIDGDYEQYYKNGNLAGKFQRQNGALEGKQYIYDVEGNLVADGVYKDDVPFNGRFINNWNDFNRYYGTELPMSFDVLTVEDGEVISSENVYLW